MEGAHHRAKNTERERETATTAFGDYGTGIRRSRNLSGAGADHVSRSQLTPFPVLCLRQYVQIILLHVSRYNHCIITCTSDHASASTFTLMKLIHRPLW